MPNIAVLIDAENVLPIHAAQIFNQASDIGTIIFKEIYGAAQALTSWVEPVLRYAMHPNLTIKASKGKNTSDIALVIGAMDLLVGRQADTVIIASSDSDFSALSVRLRAAGIEVIGMGTEKANPLWRTACSRFITLETPTVAKPAAKPATPAKLEPPAISVPSAAPAAAPARAAQPAQPVKTPAPRVAPTHNERIAIIRARITELLRSNSGQMLVATLFHNLNKLPEYRVDQQGSKRKPLNYLTGMFNDAFFFQNSPSGTLISLTPFASDSETPAAEPPAVPAETADEGSAPQDKPDGSTPETAEAAAPVSEAAETAAVPDILPASASEPSEDQPVPASAPKGKTARLNPKTRKDDVPEAAAGQPAPAPVTVAPADGSLQELALPPRILKALEAAGLSAVRDIAAMSESDLLQIRNIGAAASKTILNALKAWQG